VGPFGFVQTLLKKAVQPYLYHFLRKLHLRAWAGMDQIVQFIFHKLRQTQVLIHIINTGHLEKCRKKSEKGVIFFLKKCNFCQKVRKITIFAQKCEKVQFLHRVKSCKRVQFFKFKVQKKFNFFNKKWQKECEFYHFLTRQFRPAIFEPFVYIATSDWISLQPIRNFDSILNSSQTLCRFYKERLMYVFQFELDRLWFQLKNWLIFQKNFVLYKAIESSRLLNEFW